MEMRARDAQAPTSESAIGAPQAASSVLASSAASLNELRDRLASLSRGARVAWPPRKEPERVMPKGFEPVATPAGTAWRWAEVLPEGRLRRGPAAPELGGLEPDAFAFLD